MNFDNYKDKGLSGLANLGNTCFINSCMQVLSHCYEFNQLLDSGSYKKKLKKTYESALLVEWDNLRQILWKENCIVSPGKFIKTIQQVAYLKKMDIFTGYSQNDLPEFLLFIIDCFHTALSREIKMNISGEIENDTDKIAVKCYEVIKKMYTNEYSEIWNLFYGIHVSEIRSTENNEIIQMNPEPFFMINLPIPLNNNNPTLYDCLDLYVEGEILQNENAWFNEEKGVKQDIQKKISVWSFPSILVMDLKKFNARNIKTNILVSFPLDELNLSKYVIGYKKNSYIYELFGVCNHSGGVLGGHYTAYVKNANGKWYHFNDTSVTEIGIKESIISSKAYCLFYRKKTLL
jgi:ubiquitin carboxyl-terminal hydrolase 8